MSSSKIIDQVLLNLLNLDDENIKTLTKQKIIPCTAERFTGITLLDDNLRNLSTVVWNEETGRPLSWHHGTMEMVVESWDETGIVTLSDLDKLKRRDYFTPLGVQYRTVIEDLHGNVFEQYLVEFNKDGIAISEKQTHLETYNDSLDPDVIDIRLIKGGSSTETYKIENGRAVKRLSSDGETIEEYIYENDLHVATVNSYHRTDFEYDEFGNLIKSTKRIVGEHSDELDEVTELKYRYTTDGEFPGQIDYIELAGQIIFSAVRYRMNK